MLHVIVQGSGVLLGAGRDAREAPAGISMAQKNGPDSPSGGAAPCYEEIIGLCFPAERMQPQG
jgi:hypothetical protein